MATLIEKLDARWYPEFAGYWDDTLLREAILQRLRPEHHAMDLGAGAGILPQMNFRGMAARVCGVDLDPRVTSNPYLDEAKVGSAENLPYPDASFDVVFADNVLEHLPEPQRVFAEIHRVLRPGGWFIAKTPNKWHYMPVIARLTPFAFHRFYNRLRGRLDVDTFPTLYRANSPAEVRALAVQAGLRTSFVRLVEGRPEYLRLSAITYAAGRLYERLVNRFPSLARFRILLLIELQKPA